MGTIEVYQKIIETITLSNHSVRGAGPSLIQDLERELGVDLPVELVDLYLHTNGNNDDTGVFSGYQFLSIEEIYQAIDSLTEGASNFNELETFPCHPEGTIKKVSYSEYWVPFGGKDTGNYIGVDLDPGPNGISGQIINFGPEEYFRVQIAESLQDFLEELLDGYRREEYHYSFNSVGIVDSIISNVQ